jgi:hypothetical protein
MTNRLPLILLALAVPLGACRPRHLVYVYEAEVGLDVAYSAEGTGKLHFGYNRDTYAIVPQKKDDEIMALSAVSQVKATGLEALDFSHFIATGDAAKSVAMDPAGMEKIRGAIFGDEQ